MMERRLADLLAECLERIDREGVTIEQAVSRYPEDAAELRSLIRTIQQVEMNASATPRAEFQAVAKTRLYNRIAALPKPAAQPSHVTFSEPARLKPRKQQTLLRRFSMSWIMIIVAAASLLLGGGGVAYASTDALPGDALYPVKAIIQEVELALVDDEGDVDLLLGFMQENIQAMFQLADQGRWDDLEVGLAQYQGNLETMLKTRTRLSYDDVPSETAALSRIQTELQTQAQLLLQLQLRLQDQTQLQEKIQQAIQQTDQGNVYGPAEGGPAEETGTPNGAGPGEPQGTQVQQQTQTQNQNGQPEETAVPQGTGGPSGDSGQGQNFCGQTTLVDGEELEEDALCATQSSDDPGEGKGTGQGGRP